MIEKYGNIISGTVILIFSVAIFVATFSFKAITVSSVGPGFMPKLAAILLAILSITVILKGVNEIKKQNKKDTMENTDNDNVIDKFSVIITFVIIAIYITFIEKVGFIIMTALYLFSQMCILSMKEQRRLALFAILAVVISIGIYCLFVYAFRLILPAGILG